jgi:hypothetical protein
LLKQKVCAIYRLKAFAANAVMAQKMAYQFFDQFRPLPKG